MDAEGTIRAFDADSGAPLWTFAQDQEDGLIGGGLAYANGWLFATLSSGEVLGLDAGERHRDLAAVAGVAAARRADRRRGPGPGAERRQPAVRAGRHDRPPGVAPCRLPRGRRPARRSQPGGRSRSGGRAVLLGRGVRAPPRQRRALVERHRRAAAPDPGPRPDHRHRRHAGDRGRHGLRRRLRRADGGDRRPARHPGSGTSTSPAPTRRGWPAISSSC